MDMRKLLSLFSIITSLTLAFSCSEPDAPGNEPAPEPTPGEGGGDQTELVLGDYYKKGLAEGIIAYINEEGNGGILISIDETMAQWSTDYELLTKMGGEFSWEDGAYNCAYIRYLEDWENRYPAFAWCHAKNVLGLSSWFMPAIDEFRLIQPALKAINETLTKMGETPIATGINDYYWTSVEIGVQSAYAYSFANGDLADYDLDKKNYHHVRAIRKF